MYLAEGGTELNYRVSVYGDSGRRIPLTEHGKAVLNSDVVMGNVNLQLKPGEEREELLDISSLDDLSAPGNYWVSVKRKVYRLRDKGVVQAESNTVHLEVLKK